MAQFARNILIARLLSVEDFGIAATFAVLFTLIETASDIGGNRMIVQDPEGDDAAFQGTMHVMQMLRGVIGALAMLALAWPYALILNTPEVLWAYMAMAVVPLLRGGMHFDIFRLQRHMRFGPIGLTQGLSPLLSILVVLVGFVVTPDYSIMLYAIIAQQVIEVALSHAFAQRPYRMVWNGPLMRRAVIFGLPLMVNGLLMFAIMNGDRLIVGNQLGMQELGLFSAVFLLTLIPTTVLASTQSNVMLPPLSKVQDDPEAFNPLALTCLELTMLIGMVTMIGVAFLCTAILLAAYGLKYAPALAIMIPLGTMQAMRVCKAGPATIALARGQTTNAMYANLARVAMLPVAFAVLAAGQGLIALVLVALLGELLAVMVSVALLRVRLGVPVGKLVLSYGLFAITLVAVIADSLLVPPSADLLANIHWAQAGLIGLFGLFCLSLGHLRRWALARWRSRGQAAP